MESSAHFQTIASAIQYIQDNFRSQPSLEAIAAHVHMSPFHFQRLFTDWAGISPKKFLQYTSIEYAKGLLQQQPATLFDAAIETGLSGTSRLHDMFVNIEGMTPGEYKNGGAALLINYSFASSPFGDVLVASTGKGICHMAFADDEATALQVLQQKFPNARYHRYTDALQQQALQIFSKDWSQLQQIKLHLRGTEFQLKVWEALLKIPMGGLSTYGQLAQHIGHPQASRAVGTAIGSNPIAYLIPCHRVIQGSGETGGYRWGSLRKTAIIGWEGAAMEPGASAVSA